MKSAFATTWKSSVQPRKQRKYAHNAPYHVMGSFLGVHLSKELREKHGTRSVRVKVGDTVKILRGEDKGKTGKVERVDVQKTKVSVEKMLKTKADGSTSQKEFNPSNLIITELNLDDKRRKAKLEKEK